jgi:hypothetical protein
MYILNLNSTKEFKYILLIQNGVIFFNLNFVYECVGAQSFG